jgi:hypothetical protein
MLFILILLIILLNAADVLTTLAILKRGGKEENPIMRWLIDRNLFLPAKALLTLVVCLALVCLPHVWAVAAGAFIALAYVAIVVHNCLQLRST